MKIKTLTTVLLAGLLLPLAALACDTDNDGICDVKDNCVLVANVDQLDTDADGFGNACDADFNNDCIINFADIFIFRNAFFSHDPTCDMTGDGWVNFEDLQLIRLPFFAKPGPSGLAVCK